MSSVLGPQVRMRREMWLLSHSRILLYGALKGAPLTKRGKVLLRQQRERTRAALKGFKRMATAHGVELPTEVVHSILLLAGVEIPESLGHIVSV
jgi:hypothetical protein